MEYNSIVYIYHISFIHSPVDGWFHILAIGKSATIIIKYAGETKEEEEGDGLLQSRRKLS